MAFKPATKEQAKLRMMLMGPAGSGKTFTALRIAKGLGGRIAVADTEAGSASKYAKAIVPFETTDKSDFPDFHPHRYVKVIQNAEREGFDVLILDGLSPAWNGKGGAQELLDQAVKRSKSGNSYMAWGEITPIWNSLFEAVLHSGIHVIATARSKMDYILETNAKGQQVPKRVGMAPQLRDGVEYEFDVVMDLDNGTGVITKSRAPDLNGKVIQHPGEALGEQLKAWLSDGEPAPAPEPVDELALAEWTHSLEAIEDEAALMRELPRAKAIQSEPLRKAVGAMFNARLRQLKSQPTP
jgi:hypothetical protein